MNKIVKIDIDGAIFNIDESAYVNIDSIVQLVGDYILDANNFECDKCETVYSRDLAVELFDEEVCKNCEAEVYKNWKKLTLKEAIELYKKDDECICCDDYGCEDGFVGLDGLETLSDYEDNLYITVEDYKRLTESEA